MSSVFDGFESGLASSFRLRTREACGPGLADDAEAVPEAAGAVVAAGAASGVVDRRPPRVMTLMVSPRAASMQIEVKIERGIETQTIRVLRQLPRKSKIMSAVRKAAILASRRTSLMEERTKTD